MTDTERIDFIEQHGFAVMPPIAYVDKGTRWICGWYDQGFAGSDVTAGEGPSIDTYGSGATWREAIDEAVVKMAEREVRIRHFERKS